MDQVSRGTADPCLGQKCIAGPTQPPLKRCLGRTWTESWMPSWRGRRTSAPGSTGRCTGTASLYLLEAGETADRALVFLFALLHDAMRQDDGYDLGHGPRAAELLAELRQ